LETLKSKITLLETLIETERQRTRNLEEERDVAIKDMVRAQNEAHGMKSENKALRTEVANLRKQLHDGNSVPVQKPFSAKERVKELVEAERKREQSHKSRVQPDTEVVRESFIKVNIFLAKLIVAGRNRGTAKRNQISSRYQSQGRFRKTRAHEANSRR
jgi:regulator of replication initiation timing